MRTSKLLILCLLAALLFSSWTPASAAASQVGRAAKTYRLTIENRSHGTVTLSLSGPAKYKVTAPQGFSSVDVVAGTYSYAYTACKQKKTGKLNINAATKLVMVACDSSYSELEYISVDIVNKTGGPLTLSLTGQKTLSGKNFSFTIRPGTTAIKIYRGFYRYEAVGCGGAKLKGKTWLTPGTKEWVFTCR